MGPTPAPSSPNGFIRYFSYALRFLSAALALIAGLFLMYQAIRLSIYEVGDIAWRLPKGYLVWEIHSTMIALTVFMAAFASLCFLLANAAYRWRWSRRTRLWVIATGTVAAVSVVTAIGIFVVTFPVMD